MLYQQMQNRLDTILNVHIHTLDCFCSKFMFEFFVDVSPSIP